MLPRFIFFSAALGLGTYGSAIYLNIDARNIPFLQEIMYASIAVGLYINVLGIDRSILKGCLDSIAKVIFVGVPLKILIPGFLLSILSPQIRATSYLCATVIAQIDPIAAGKSLECSKISSKSATILRAWSSFDDPITVLFAFYIFLPALLLENFNFAEYFISYILKDIIICFLVYQIYTIYQQKIIIKYRQKLIIDTILIILTILYSIIFKSFLLPATIGLFIRPFESEIFTRITSGIFLLSALILGLMSANVKLYWYSGFILAVATFFVAQIIVTQIFIKDSMNSKARVMFGHQNGMTAMLLTIAIEMSASQETNNLLSVTLPAIIWIALFYFGSNYILDRVLPSVKEESSANNIQNKISNRKI